MSVWLPVASNCLHHSVSTLTSSADHQLSSSSRGERATTKRSKCAIQNAHQISYNPCLEVKDRELPTGKSLIDMYSKRSASLIHKVCELHLFYTTMSTVVPYSGRRTCSPHTRIRLGVYCKVSSCSYQFELGSQRNVAGQKVSEKETTVCLYRMNSRMPTPIWLRGSTRLHGNSMTLRSSWLIVRVGRYKIARNDDAMAPTSLQTYKSQPYQRRARFPLPTLPRKINHRHNCPVISRLRILQGT